jgi:hypothetical protein
MTFGLDMRFPAINSLSTVRFLEEACLFAYTIEATFCRQPAENKSYRQPDAQQVKSFER